MLGTLTRRIGGYAMSHRDLRLLFAAIFLSFLGASLTFPLRLLYAQAHHATPSQLGLMAGAFVAAPLVAQVPMGWLVDRWGRVPVLLIGLIAHPILSLLYVPFNTPTELIALRFLEGLTVAAFQPAIGAYIADVTPEEHRSEAYGAFGATLNAGLLIGPLVGGVIGQSFGFVTAFLANVAIEALAIPLVLGHVHEPRVHQVTGREPEEATFRALFSLPLMSVYVATFTMQAVMGVLGALWAIWVHDLGGSYTYIGFTFSIFALPQIFFGASAGRMADRWGRARFLLISGVACGVIYAAYGLQTNLAVIMALGLVEGMLFVFQGPVVQGLLAEAAPERARGRVQGIAGVGGSIGGAVASFAALWLYHQSHELPFVLTGVVMITGSSLAAAGAAAFARRRGLQPDEERALRTA